ncbi:response regulator [Streptomyces sp. NPDC059002]|uniref:response regulator n=1 Tax=Streptomyces sp. NPDC059002 TaxID=3346690 RepID=UPI0036A39305
MIRALVVDDDPIVREGLTHIFASTQDIHVVAEAGDGRQAVALARTIQPDVVLIDIRMPHMDGLTATRDIAQLNPPPQVIVLTTFDDDEYIHTALRNGAAGFLLKRTAPQELIHAVRVIAAGSAMLSPTVTRKLIDTLDSAGTRLGPAERAAIASLTDREHEVLTAITRGLSNAEIAAEMHLSESTIKVHCRHLFAKLGVNNRVRAALIAHHAGLPGT